MLSSAFMMLLSSAFVMLRLGTNTGSFPKPLKAEEERKLVDRWLNGDYDARNILIEHNLRLVAHIIKNISYKRRIACSSKFCILIHEFYSFPAFD